jgi:hypothetical protein
LKRIEVVAAIGIVLALAVVHAAPTEQHEHPGGATGRLGTVHFANSCSQAVQPTFDRAVALLHSFEFARGIAAFNQTLDADPSCGIAYWGIALSRWGNPFGIGLRPAAQLQQGRDAVDKGLAAGVRTPREQAYIDAVARLYRDTDTIEQRARMLAYRDAMADVARRFPDDAEASIFYALSLTASEEPDDKTYAGRLKAGAILEKLYASQPDHPGLAHYIIHTYDVPPLAGRALDAASRYAKIAPDAPHALHMPAHTFTRVGYWQESIDTNIASAAAARRDRATSEELHASDYQMYAYLQTAQDTAAKRLLDALPEIVSRFDPNSPGSAAPPAAGWFAYAAIPARWALERGAWAEAAALEPHASDLPYTEAITYFARALGAARSGDAAAARRSVAVLAQLRDREAAMNEPYWTDQIEIQRRAASAWLTLAEGRKGDALAEMRAAADAEDRTEKPAVTPGPLAPARELLGDMLLEVKEPAQALKEFEATLSKEPNRFRALNGAARAARLAGNQSAAAKYAADLLKVCARGDRPGRPELQDARRHAP